MFLPIEKCYFSNSDGLNYNEAFSYQFSCKALMYGIEPFIGSIVFSCIAKMIRARCAKKKLTSLKSAQSGNSELEVDFATSYHSPEESDNIPNDHRQQVVQCILWFFNGLSIVCSWFALACFAITPAIFSGLGVIPSPLAALFILLIFSVKFISMIFWYCPAFLKKKTLKQSATQNFLRRITLTVEIHKVRFALFFGLAVLYAIVVPLLTKDTCLNFFNEGYGSNYEGFGVSTRFSRYFQLNNVCPNGEICHIYATLAEDASTGIILNVHTGQDVSSIEIRYDKETKETLDGKITAQSYHVDLEERGARYVHSAFIDNLEPNTKYNFVVFYHEKVQAQNSFMTFPTKELERDIVIAAGGDAGTTARAKKMTSVLADQKPDAILVGGDISYDNGIRSCYYSMDLFLRMFEDINKKMKRLVPLMFSIGNHDIGFNAFQDGYVDIAKNLYYIFFPQETTLTKEGARVLPDIKERSSYYYHALGNTVHLSLDSGYMLGYAGEQEEWIKKVAENYPSYVKMANFHVPMYPTCFSEKYDNIKTIEEPKKYWAPLFEKYKFASVFENHVHLYKKTFPIIKDKAQHESQDGVIYFGDGNWGISPNYCQSNPANLNRTGHLEAFSNVTHVWLISINQTYMSHFAVNPAGEIFDKAYDLEIKRYLN